jgi:CBS domain-containing protein
MRVQDLMTTQPFICQSNQNLYVVAQMMWDHDCGAILIVDDKGHLAGMVTDRDICMAAFTQGRALQELPIHIAMSRQIYSARPEQDAAEVRALMAEHQVRRIPVVDALRKPIGIVTLKDLARDPTTAPKLPQTLAQIWRPHAETKRAA